MESFLLGFITSIVSYIMAYSYMNRETKRKFNYYFCNPITDIIITSGAMMLSVGTSGSLFMAIGIGFGLSLSLKASKWLYGVGE